MRNELGVGNSLIHGEQGLPYFFLQPCLFSNFASFGSHFVFVFPTIFSRHAWTGYAKMASATSECRSIASGVLRVEQLARFRVLHGLVQKQGKISQHVTQCIRHFSHFIHIGCIGLQFR